MKDQILLECYTAQKSIRSDATERTGPVTMSSAIKPDMNRGLLE
jgi:hypothetical protein